MKKLGRPLSVKAGWHRKPKSYSLPEWVHTRLEKEAGKAGITASAYLLNLIYQTIKNPKP